MEKLLVAHKLASQCKNLEKKILLNSGLLGWKMNLSDMYMIKLSNKNKQNVIFKQFLFRKFQNRWAWMKDNLN